MVLGLIILNLVLAMILLNLYYHRETTKSLDKVLKNISWDNLPKEEYAERSYHFIAERFTKVNRCWLRFPLRNIFFYNMWKMKGKGLPCHMMNTLFQRCLLKKFNKKEFKTVFASKGDMVIHFYSKVKLNGKWIDVDVWGKKWGIPFGKNINNSEVI